MFTYHRPSEQFNMFELHIGVLNERIRSHLHFKFQWSFNQKFYPYLKNEAMNLLSLGTSSALSGASQFQFRFSNPTGIFVCI